MQQCSAIKAWKIFYIERPDPHLQLSFATEDGLVTKDLYLKHPRRAKTIKFLADIGGVGTFRALADLEDIIRRANFQPVSVEWVYDSRGDKQVVKVNRRWG